MKTRILIFSAILIPALAFARLGETPEQCDARYGQPIKVTEDGSRAYEKSGVNIFVMYFDGKADCIVYMKVERDALNKPVALSDNEINLLLKSNSNGKEWSQKPVISMNREWTFENGVMSAAYLTIDRNLIVASKEYLKRSEDEKAEAEKKKLEGF